jgi:hypothetical protein
MTHKLLLARAIEREEQRGCNVGSATTTADAACSRRNEKEEEREKREGNNDACCGVGTTTH